VLLFCAVLFAGCLPLQAQPTAPARVVCLPTAIELADGPSLLDVQILEDGLASVHVRLDGKASPRTLVINPQPVLRAASTVSRSEQHGIYLLSAQGISVKVEETKPYKITFLNSKGQQLLQSDDPFGAARDLGVTMEHAAKDTLYGIHGLGRDDTGAGVTRNDGGHVAAGIQGDSGAPLIFSARYALLVDSDGGDFTAKLGSISFRHSSRPDIEYFVFAGPPLETMASLSRLVGPPPLPPKWTLGFLNSQWSSTQAEVEDIISRYRKEQLPIDGFILDFDWKAWGEDNYGEWRWNSSSGSGNVAPDKFPDGANGDFSERLAGEGIKLAGILKPRILMTIAGDANQPTEAAAYATAHNFWYPGENPTPDYFSHRPARDLDFNNPDERKWFWEHLLPAFHAGMVGWWNDEADLSGDTTFNNFQFLNMGRMLYEGQRADSNLRVWSINRSFYLGASRYGYAGWSGDIKTGFDSMAFQRRRMLAALDTGEFHWSMDTGGFDGHPSPENYARWMEFAAFVPIMRVHGGLDEKRQPWVYGPVAEAAARNALDLRYELLPCIYSYERLNTEGNVGLVRPVYWDFPSDPGSAMQESEWMFGDAFLVAPVANEGATSESVYLPPGEWFDFNNGLRYTGRQNVTVATDAKAWDDIPLFVRDGSIVASQPLEQYVGQQPVTEITLDVFPAQTAGAFTEYDDDGETFDYEKGDYLRQQITARRSGNVTEIRIEPSTGSYASRLRTYLLRVHTSAHDVALNGKVVPRRDAYSSADRPVTGWSLEKDRFGAVVVISVNAGAKSSSTIALR
jgi:alpha-glucosidase